LFIVHVPRESDRYADLSTSGLLLRHIGYYVSLSERQPLPSPERNHRIRVKIPVSNVLTVESLRSLVARNSTALVAAP
jgi:hypothetical protein